MKRLLHSKGMWTALAAVILVLSISVGSTFAYFTTYAEAEGGHVLQLHHDTRTKEEFSDWTKHVVLTNTGDRDCFVRLKAFCGSQLELEFSDANGKWSLGEDGYYYYSDILPVGADTLPIDIRINLPEGWDTDFNVVVVQECTLVLYDENNQPYADWSMVFDHRDTYPVEGGD